MNDLHSSAVTSCIMKVLERVVWVHSRNRLQITLILARGVENAILHVLNTIRSHLEKPTTCIRLVL